MSKMRYHAKIRKSTCDFNLEIPSQCMPVSFVREINIEMVCAEFSS